MQDDTAELFYENFWRTEQWGGTEPNRDELARLGAITQLLKSHRSGGECLDLGCGRGWLTAELAAFGPVMGIDVVAAAVDRARELYPQLRFEHATVGELNESRGTASFDLIVASEVLEHVVDADKANFFADVRAALRPGGHLLITTPRAELRDAWTTSIDTDQPVEDWISEPGLDQLASAHQLALIERSRCGVYPIGRLRSSLCTRPARFLADRVTRVADWRNTFGVYQVALFRAA